MATCVFMAVETTRETHPNTNTCDSHIDNTVVIMSIIFVIDLPVRMNHGPRVAVDVGKLLWLIFVLVIQEFLVLETSSPCELDNIAHRRG